MLTCNVFLIMLGLCLNFFFKVPVDVNGEVLGRLVTVGLPAA